MVNQSCCARALCIASINAVVHDCCPELSVEHRYQRLSHLLEKDVKHTFHKKVSHILCSSAYPNASYM